MSTLDCLLFQSAPKLMKTTSLKRSGFKKMEELQTGKESRCRSQWRLRCRCRYLGNLQVQVPMQEKEEEVSVLEQEEEEEERR